MSSLNLKETQSNTSESNGILYPISSKRENCLLTGEYGFKLFAVQEVMADHDWVVEHPP